MAEIIKCYRQSIPAVRFIGKKYGDGDRVNGNFGAKWGEWFANGWFGFLEKQANTDLKQTYEDGDAYLGLMRWEENEQFEYWIGIFFPENTAVPEGFGYVDFHAGDLFTCWIYGKEKGDNIYWMHDACEKKMQENNFSIKDDFGNGKGEYWFFERYGCPRFTTPDENGNIILDYCFFIK